MASPTTNETQAVSCFSMLPEEKIIQIFGLFDCQTLGRIARVCKFFERLQKDDALWVVKFGSNLMDRCVLDLRKKTITTQLPWPGLRHCIPAMNYPAIPKGSFVVFVETNSPSAVIKDREGLVGYSSDLGNDSEIALIDFTKNVSPRVRDVIYEFRKHVGGPTQYDHFKIIAPNPKSMKEGYIEAQQLLALTFLEAINFTDIQYMDNLRQWRLS